MKKKLGTVLAASATILGSMVAIAPAAHASGYGCNGTLVDSYPVRTSGGTQYGTIYLYWDAPASQNCVVNVATAAGGYGTSKHMDVNLVVCTTDTPGAICSTLHDAYDSGNYAYYAGPASAFAGGKCILVDGHVDYNGVEASYVMPTPSHC